MKKGTLYCNYFTSTSPIWILLLICIYSVLACEFESLRINILLIDKEQAFLNKINDIIKNLSFSYIAGVIFFFLSDTIPFLRRKKIAYKNIHNSLRLIINAIDEFSKSVNGKIWDKKTEMEMIFEDISGGEYIDNILFKIPVNLTTVFNQLFIVLNTNIDFIISQELYVEVELIKDMEMIKTNENFILINSISTNNGENHLPAKKMVEIFNNIRAIKNMISKYIQLC